MPRNLPPHPAKASLSENIDHRLKLYSAAAAVAGVSMLALAQPAEGEVVVTKKNIPINVGSPAFVDLNKDGIADFEFSVTTFRTNRSSHLNVKEIAKPLTGGKVVGGHLGSLPGPYASALVRGARIGPSAHFSSASGQITIQRLSAYASGGGRSYGNWSYYSGKNHFLGVRFLIKGETHYGWIRLALGSGRSTVPSSVNGYGYETIANKRISAGIPSKNSADNQTPENVGRPGSPSLGILALGADGLALWRREEPSH